jgi:ABC-type nitrate/sulfonate/bicarbonate transport system ATPase subunit
LLLLDEPLSALDNEMRNTLQDEILHIHNLWEFHNPCEYTICLRCSSYATGL